MRKQRGFALVLGLGVGVVLVGCESGPTDPLGLISPEGPAFAWTIDLETGEGFVGKGDVQEVFGWNNGQLQQNAEHVRFRVSSELVTEVTWVCTNTNNNNIQERERTTTTTVEGVLSSVARARNQVTGFILEEYDGNPVVGQPETEGPPLNSCPSGPWVLATAAGDPEVVSESGGLEVSNDGDTWLPLPDQDAE